MIDYQCRLLNRFLMLLFSLYSFMPSVAAEVQEKGNSSLFTAQVLEFSEDRIIERQQVTRETLIKVRSRITRLSSYLESRIEQLGVGSGGEGPRDCRRFQTVEQCRAQSECRWVRRPGSREGMCIDRSESSLENDSLAGLALLYLSREVTRLGELIDQAIFAFPSPQYISYIAESCNLAREIRNRAQAAKLSATLPPVGLIGPAEFDPVINEMIAVRSDLQCL